jgi:hypothetical protein
MRKYSVIFLLVGIFAATAAVPRTWRDTPTVQGSGAWGSTAKVLDQHKAVHRVPDLLPLRPV